jgi:hypothetical protein
MIQDLQGKGNLCAIDGFLGGFRTIPAEGGTWRLMFGQKLSKPGQRMAQSAGARFAECTGSQLRERRDFPRKHGSLGVEKIQIGG